MVFVRTTCTGVFFGWGSPDAKQCLTDHKDLCLSTKQGFIGDQSWGLDPKTCLGGYCLGIISKERWRFRYSKPRRWFVLLWLYYHSLSLNVAPVRHHICSFIYGQSVLLIGSLAVLCTEKVCRIFWNERELDDDQFIWRYDISDTYIYIYVHSSTMSFPQKLKDSTLPNDWQCIMIPHVFSLQLSFCKLGIHVYILARYSQAMIAYSKGKPLRFTNPKSSPSTPSTIIRWKNSCVPEVKQRLI